MIRKDSLKDKFLSILPDTPEKYIDVNVELQQMTLFHNDLSVCSFPVSTSGYGVGNRINSFMTPTGIHLIKEKIGSGAPSGMIFKDRKSSGKIWTAETNEENLILTRILRLKGLEPGINLGSGIDSFKRYIYIHGTNREDLIGTPFSHGCICMKNDDIIRLFDSVEEETIVYIG